MENHKNTTKKSILEKSELVDVPSTHISNENKFSLRKLFIKKPSYRKSSKISVKKSRALNPVYSKTETVNLYKTSQISLGKSQSRNENTRKKSKKISDLSKSIHHQKKSSGKREGPGPLRTCPRSAPATAKKSSKLTSSEKF